MWMNIIQDMITLYPKHILLEAKLPYDPICPSVGWLVGLCFIILSIMYPILLSSVRTLWQLFSSLESICYRIQAVYMNYHFWQEFSIFPFKFKAASVVELFEKSFSIFALRTQRDFLLLLLLLCLSLLLFSLLLMMLSTIIIW